MSDFVARGRTLEAFVADLHRQLEGDELAELRRALADRHAGPDGEWIDTDLGLEFLRAPEGDQIEHLCDHIREAIYECANMAKNAAGLTALDTLIELLVLTDQHPEGSET